MSAAQQPERLSAGDSTGIQPCQYHLHDNLFHWRFTRYFLCRIRMDPRQLARSLHRGHYLCVHFLSHHAKQQEIRILKRDYTCNKQEHKKRLYSPQSRNIISFVLLRLKPAFRQPAVNYIFSSPYISFHQLPSSCSHLANQAKMVSCHLRRFS